MVKDTKNKEKAAKPRKMIPNMMPVSAKPAVSDFIAHRLLNYYNAVAEQPVPDRFLDLLNQLEAANAEKKSE